MVRKHGWQLPAHTFQVVAITVFCLLVVAFYAFLAPFLGGQLWNYILLVTYSPVVALVFILYVRCTAINPADPGIMPKFQSELRNNTRISHGLSARNLTQKYDENSHSSISSASTSSNPVARKASVEAGSTDAQVISQNSRFSCWHIICAVFVLEDCRKQEGTGDLEGTAEDALFCTLCDAESVLAHALLPVAFSESCLSMAAARAYGRFLVVAYCALVSDETEATYSWVMRTWLKAMGGQAPKLLLTDQDMVFKSIVPEIFPSSFHYFFLWQIMGKVTETLNTVIKQNESFLAKFDKCIYRSWIEEEFEKRWLKLVDRFELKENELMQSLYEDRTKWVPLFVGDACFAGMSTVNRSECVTSYFDKFLHKKTSVQDFTRQYEAILQDRYEEEGKADSDTLNKQPALRSPSPFEKHVATIYTHAVFKRFQVEVLGAVACIPKKERQQETTITFRVEDFQKNQDFVVTLNELKLEVSCMCHLFEYKGYLCRHAMVVLQICGISTIPTQYILRRWSRDAKNRYSVGEGSEQLQSRVQRYNELCQRAMKLGEEASLSQESYNFALRALDGALKNCLSVNHSNKNPAEAGISTTSSFLCIEDNDQRSTTKVNKAAKKANSTKKRKVNSESDVMTVGSSDSLQQMDKLSSRPVNFDGCFGPQQGVPGMVQLNLMAPTRDNIYANQQSLQGLGQLNTIVPSQDGFYVHGLGQMDFFRSSNYAYGMREEANIRSAQLHEDPTRHT